MLPVRPVGDVLQVKRSFRLTRSEDIKRVRRAGKSYAHPLLVLYATVSGREGVRVGVSAGRTVGSAISRNRAKRVLRAAASALLPQVHPGNDLLLIARSPLAAADFDQAHQALSKLLSRAGILEPLDV
ncbi:MAG: ribonuclease P protein component [Chloroflexi bacterium]|nr:ribonuclease P protein component [Chloroflexota bacterium]